jgi:Uma2 family endonuclease
MLHDNSESLLEAVLDRPEAPHIVARLQSRLEAERRRREQFYADIDDDEKAEFINGEIVIHSPVKKEHTEVVGALYKVLDVFVRLAKMGFVGYEKVLTALTRNDYEPDIVFFNAQKSEHFKKGHWKYPAPDLVVEVLSESTESRDRGIKFQDYAAHGVQEYWIIDPAEESVEQYFLTDAGVYKLHLKAGQGLIESRVVTGFAIDIRAVFDEAANMEALRRMLKSEETR